MTMRQHTSFIFTAFLLFLFALYSNLHISRDVLTVAFLDVGQGDAIFIETPSGKQMLIDGGVGRAVLSELSSVMPFFDRSIDVVLNTHPDKDHIGGLPDVFENYNVALVIDPAVPVDKASYEEYEEDVVIEAARHVVARRGQTLLFGDGVELHILFPDRDMSNVKNTNDASIIARLTYGETEVMLTGDAPESIERYLVSLGAENLKSDILKAGHHGSRTSTSEEFVVAVDPVYTIISAGKDNSYGHPHKEVIDTLTTASTTILGTYNEGTIIFESDGISWERN